MNKKKQNSEIAKVPDAIVKKGEPSNNTTETKNDKSKDINVLGLYMGHRFKQIRTNSGIGRKDLAVGTGLTEVAVFKFETTGNTRGESFRRMLNYVYKITKLNPGYIILEDNSNIPP